MTLGEVGFDDDGIHTAFVARTPVTEEIERGDVSLLVRVIPLLDGGEAVGAIDFQTERTGAFDLDAVAVGETLAEFLVVALRNARLFSESRRGQD